MTDVIQNTRTSIGCQVMSFATSIRKNQLLHPPQQMKIEFWFCFLFDQKNFVFAKLQISVELGLYWKRADWREHMPLFQLSTNWKIIKIAFLSFAPMMRYYILNCKINSTNAGTFSNLAEKILERFFLEQKTDCALLDQPQYQKSWVLKMWKFFQILWKEIILDWFLFMDWLTTQMWKSLIFRET